MPKRVKTEPNKGLSEISIKYMAKTPAEHKKKYGQFFTKKSVRENLFSLLPDTQFSHIWEPSAGTGEFVADLVERYPSAHITANEIDPNLVDCLRQQFGDRVALIGEDSLWSAEGGYDLVIGNPPYFEWSMAELRKHDPLLAARLADKFGDISGGRLNIYAAFVKVAVDALKPGGRLAFVIPPSMNNGAYFAKLRRYVHARCDIEALKVLRSDEFVEAQQSVMLLVLRRRESGDPVSINHVVEKGDFFLFVERPEEFADLLSAGRTLEELGFEVFTGQVVWNQHKKRLTTEGGTNVVPLIWSHNIRNGAVDIDSPALAKKKPQFINVAPMEDLVGIEKKVLSGPAIMVNRIVGTVGRGRIKAGLYNGTAYTAENHINVVRPLTPEATALTEKVLGALLDPRTSQTIQRLTGNSQISATELGQLIPLVVD